MKDKIKPIREIEFKEKNPLFFDKIEDGFANYEHLLLHGMEQEYSELLENLLSLNGESNSFFDFYYSRLQEDEKLRFIDRLQVEESQYLDQIHWSDGIYFPLTREIISFLSAVTAREILFSTFYFSTYPCILWGNYDLKYPLFFLDPEVKAIIQNLALSCGLNIL